MLRLVASALALAAGATFAAAALAAGAAGAARGGTLRIDSRQDFDFADPALAYFTHTWQLEHVTCDRLLQPADAEGSGRPLPRAAVAEPLVSKDGRRYVFTLRNGLRFSNGEEVTAATFVYAWNRALAPELQSPAQSFMDVIEGAAAVIGGRTETATGLRALDKRRLEVRLTRVAPDFLSRVTMPFFCPLPLGTPVVPEGIEAPVPGHGPYYLKEWVKRRTALVVRNPYYRGGRAATVEQIAYTFGNALEASRLRLENGDADLGSFPVAASAELVQKYGLNKGRFFVRKSLAFTYLVLNHDRPLFRGNTKLKQAVNHAIDRPHLARQHGFLGGARTDQILPPGMPGFRDWNIYSLKRADPDRARELARGNLRGGKGVFYSSSTGTGPTIAQVVQYNLRQIGLDLEIRLFERVVQHAKMATRGEAFDIGLESWAADYPDPSNFVNVLLSGSSIGPEHNQNLAYFDDPVFNERMRRAALLEGDERYETFGLLERDLMSRAAPLAPYVNPTARVLVSDRVRNFAYTALTGTLLNVVSVN
jgi:peptide/nickel transport system substrate-binding protein